MAEGSVCYLHENDRWHGLMPVVGICPAVVSDCWLGPFLDIT